MSEFAMGPGLKSLGEIFSPRFADPEVTASGIDTTRDLAEEILQIHAGLDVTNGHGRDTPKRFVNMLDELTACKDCNGDCMKWKVFEEDVDQMIVVNQIPFSSVCNHHVGTPSAREATKYGTATPVPAERTRSGRFR